MYRCSNIKYLILHLELSLSVSSTHYNSIYHRWQGKQKLNCFWVKEVQQKTLHNILTDTSESGERKSRLRTFIEMLYSDVCQWNTGYIISSHF